MAFTPIKNWAEDDRPREKLLAKGANALSNSELLAILLGNGTRNKSAVHLAQEILQLSHNNLNQLGKLGIREFQKVSGIGKAKAVVISAALELGRRRQSEDLLPRIQVTSSRQLVDYLRVNLKDLRHEVFMVAFLNPANKLLHLETVSSGGITGTVADPRIILRMAIELGATSILLAHNHPSGNLKPSQADHSLTQKVKQAAVFMDIKVLDHIIVSEEGFFSFVDEGLM